MASTLFVLDPTPAIFFMKVHSSNWRCFWNMTTLLTCFYVKSGIAGKDRIGAHRSAKSTGMVQGENLPCK